MSAGGRDARIDRLTGLLAADGIDAATVRQLLPAPFDEARAAASAVQQRLWLINQLRAQTSAYHLPIVLRLAGALDAAALRAALTAVVARHEILRTTLAAGGGVPVQEIWPASVIDLPVVDVRIDADGDADADTVAAYRAEASRLACEPFDLGVRVSLARRAAARRRGGPLPGVRLPPREFRRRVDRRPARGFRARLLGRARRASRRCGAAADSIRRARSVAARPRSGGRARRRHRLLDAAARRACRPLDLGGDRSPAPVQTFEGGVVRRELDSALMRRLADVGVGARGDALHRGPRGVGRVAARAYR